MDISTIRALFPSLNASVYGKPFVYLDNAATYQRPQTVLDCWREMNIDFNANIHRAVHHHAVEATSRYEAARERVRSFINAETPEEIIFTSGATASINLVAFSFGEKFIKAGDEIIVSEAEHHSNLVPWQLLCERKGAVLKPLRIENSGHILVEELQKTISQKTKIIAISQISNVLGLINPVKEIIAVSHKKGIPVLIDGAQGVVHGKVDVRDLDCDFYVFSGHKIFAATGTGVLYGKKKWLDVMPPFLSGGEMIETVKFSGSTFASSPTKFEAGTQNISSVPTLVPALDFADSMFEDGDVKAEQRAITEYLLEMFHKEQRLTLYGVPDSPEEKIPLFSFSVEGAHHEDIALILDKMGFAVRSGQMCAEPLMDRMGVTGMVRCSFAPYNTLEEAEKFAKALNKAIEMLI